MNVPLGKITPSISMSSVAYLMVPLTAPQKRMHSSTARGASSG